MAENRFKSFLKEGQPFGDSVDLHFVNAAVMDRYLPYPQSFQELGRYIRTKYSSKESNQYTNGLDETLNAAKHVWELFRTTKPIITRDELRELLNGRRFDGERMADKRAIRLAAEEIERLRSALQAIAERAGDALEK